MAVFSLRQFSPTMAGPRWFWLVGFTRSITSWVGEKPVKRSWPASCSANCWKTPEWQWLNSEQGPMGVPQSSQVTRPSGTLGLLGKAY